MLFTYINYIELLFNKNCIKFHHAYWLFNHIFFRRKVVYSDLFLLIKCWTFFVINYLSLLKMFFKLIILILFIWIMKYSKKNRCECSYTFLPIAHSLLWDRNRVSTFTITYCKYCVYCVIIVNIIYNFLCYPQDNSKVFSTVRNRALVIF